MRFQGSSGGAPGGFRDVPEAYQGHAKRIMRFQFQGLQGRSTDFQRISGAYLGFQRLSGEFLGCSNEVSVAFQSVYRSDAAGLMKILWDFRWIKGRSRGIPGVSG